MSIFKKSRKQSKEGRKRMEHLMYLAKENPDKTYDLTSCEMCDVPSGVFSLCKVLQKEVLLLHSNQLKTLKSTAKITDLMCLRILDLHSNRLTSLPDEICTLVHLQVLNIEDNEITELPVRIGELASLQTLNAKDNKLKSVPPSIEKMKSLRTLDISGSNKVYYLPKKICHVRTLEVLILSNPSGMEYPPPFVAEKGLPEIMKYICKDCGVEYVPPSHSLLPVLENQSSVPTSNSNGQTDEHENSILQYEKMKDEKRKKHLEMEKHLAEAQMEQAALAARSLANRSKDLEIISKEIHEFGQTVRKQQEQQDLERKRMIAMLVDAEKHASSLVEDLLKINEKARKQEALLEEMERQRMREEDYFKVTKEDLDNLRRREMLAAMQVMLRENGECAIRVQQYLAEQKHAARKTQGAIQNEEKQVEEALVKQQQVQDRLIGQIIHEEEVQRQAFLALQWEQDVARCRIVNQIQEVEAALTNLTNVEMKRNKLKLNSSEEVLKLKREELTDLLMVLLKEKDKREEMLKERLVELEEQKENDQIDFWLVQYQRLMDSKPQSLANKETSMNMAVLKLLGKAGAEDHIPSFARHKVTKMSDLISLSDDDLRRIGVFEVMVRKNILLLCEQEITASKKLDNYESGTSEPTPLPVTPLPPSPSAPEEEEADEENECVVCMEKQSNAIFLPCGHVCACIDCASKVNKCPMCRTDIAQKIQIFRS